MQGPIGLSGVHYFAKSLHSSGFFMPLRTLPHSHPFGSLESNFLIGNFNFASNSEKSGFNF